MSPLPIRVMVEDAWDQVSLELSATMPVAEVKERALRMTHCAGAAADYLVKYRGAELLDESRTLAGAGVVANATLIVMPRRRRAVR